MYYPVRTDKSITERFVRPRPLTCWALRIDKNHPEAIRAVARRYGVTLDDMAALHGVWMVIWPDKKVDFYDEKSFDATFEGAI